MQASETSSNAWQRLGFLPARTACRLSSSTKKYLPQWQPLRLSRIPWRFRAASPSQRVWGQLCRNPPRYGDTPTASSLRRSHRAAPRSPPHPPTAPLASGTCARPVSLGRGRAAVPGSQTDPSPSLAFAPSLSARITPCLIPPATGRGRRGRREAALRTPRRERRAAAGALAPGGHGTHVGNRWHGRRGPPLGRLRGQRALQRGDACGRAGLRGRVRWRRRGAPPRRVVHL